MSTSNILPTLHLAHRSGIVCLPVKLDGSKAPAVAWKQYQHRPPTSQELQLWFPPEQEGFGAVTGKISGNLECLDFDTMPIFEKFGSSITDMGQSRLLQKVRAGYEDRSPRGVHLLYRCEVIAGNQKLAHVYERNEAGEVKRSEYGHAIIKTEIETRGEGGFVILPPSNGKTHPSGKPYVQVSGGLGSIPYISPTERDFLLSSARKLSTAWVEPPLREVPRGERREHEGTRPGDIFNSSATWPGILTPFGWQLIGEYNGVGHWRRPGKDSGSLSATTNYGNTDLLYVFSSNAGLESGKAYTKFSAYAHLNHRGDFRKAAEVLRARKGEP